MTLPDTIDRAAANKDLKTINSILERHFAYLNTNQFGRELPSLIAQLEAALPEQQTLAGWAEKLHGLLSLSIDGHARVREFKPISGAVPALFHPCGGKIVAVQPDRSDFLLPGFPFLKAIDGRPVSEWLTVVGELVAGAGATWRRERTIGGLSLVQQWRRRLNLPLLPETVLTLAGELGERDLQVRLVDEKADYGVWPPLGSRWIEQIGYLRLPAMVPRAAQEIRQWLPEFQSARGLIIDLRGNSGGMREVFLPLLRALQPEGSGPRVVNVALSRQSDAESTERLAGRFLYPQTSGHWTLEERTVIQHFMQGFKPSWTPPPGQFSDWHFMLIRPAGGGEPVVRCPVVLLTDGLCFSATDIFLCGVKGLPNVTLMGEQSGGGSGSPRVHVLPSGIQFRIASMASFKPSGELLEGNGVPVDVQVNPVPESFLKDGKDNVLHQALARLAE